VKGFNSLGVGSEWTSIVRKEIVGLSAPPAALTGFSVIKSGGLALARWNLSVDLDVQINGDIIIRFSPLTSGATWVDGYILDTFAGGVVQGTLPLITGTYMAKARDSTGNYSPTMIAFVATEGMVSGFTTVATSTQAPSFSGTKTNLTAVSNILRLTDPTVNLTGEYEFVTYLDMTTVETRRFEADIDVLCYVDTDLIDSRGDVDDWASVDGVEVDTCDATLFIATTDDDPSGSPTWSPWTQFDVSDFTCRAAKFKLELSSEQETENIDVSVLTVHVKEAT